MAATKARLVTWRDNEHVLDEHVRYRHKQGMTSPTTPRASRRERPAKPPLNRPGIIEAALRILREEGLGKVTMRRIAAALDTGPASLYVYVRDTEDLHAQVLDALLAPVGATPRGQGWRDTLKGLLRRYMDVLLAYPELARMAMSTPASGPHYLRLTDQILGLLLEGGASDHSAAWAVDLLLLYATAHAAEHGAWKASARAQAEMTALASAVLDADPGVYPHVARLSKSLMAGGPPRLDWSLDLLISGAVQAPEPVTLSKERS
jgi:AcrR family transcriptional regulator